MALLLQQLVRSIYRANKARDKTEALENFPDEFELIKLPIHLCAGLKVLPLKKQAELKLLLESMAAATAPANAAYLHPVGKQITGWNKTVSA